MSQPCPNDGLLLPDLSLDERENFLAEKLGEIHGRVVRRHESGGRHLYIACPDCRQNYGHSREGKSCHLAINVELYSKGSRLSKRSKSGKSARGYAMCMKCERVYTVNELLSYPPQPGSGPDQGGLNLKAAAGRYLVEDENGHMVADGPGDVVSLSGLPQNHPALIYLRSRNYDVSLLVAQFRAEFCTVEAPQGEEYGNRFYRRHADGMRSTPQGRIIFNGIVNGIRNCWQGRFLEINETMSGGGSRKWIWHPYRGTWVLEPVWDSNGPLVKYLTGTGCAKSQSLGGFDHVVSRARHSGDDWCVITEGPLDAARFPNHGLAVFGKFVSDLQALLIAGHFKRALLGFDTDIHGRKACAKAEKQLAQRGVRTVRFFPGDTPTESKHDIGDMDYADAMEAAMQRLATIR